MKSNSFNFDLDENVESIKTFSFTGSHDCGYDNRLVNESIFAEYEKLIKIEKKLIKEPTNEQKADEGYMKEWIEDAENKTLFNKELQNQIDTENKRLKKILEDYEGKIVVSSGQVESIEINNAIPKVILSDGKYQKNVYGVISKFDFSSSHKEKMGNLGNIKFNSKHDMGYKVSVNSVGEGGIWVSNINGNIQNGDYITTSEFKGIGLRQDDDILHNYTVAKATMDCNFENESVAFIACTYHCG